MNLRILYFLMLTALSFSISTYSKQDDTVKIFNTAVIPVIDGKGDDGCWTSAKWQTIDQVWITYGGTLNSSDFTGRYKVLWSSTENLLYFLVEVTDDFMSDGFVAGQTADVYNYDIIEVFLDENKSGGAHAYESPGSSNAENAFGYHIYSDIPEEGEVLKNCWVGDIPIPHTDHLPEYAIYNDGEIVTREFSLKVYNDKYVDENKEASRVTLSEGKVMGLSLAYCDNDDDDGVRDNFYGSVWVPASKYNNHWMESDNFGTAKLYLSNSNKINNAKSNDNLKVYPTFFSELINVESQRKINSIKVLDILGKTFLTYSNIPAGKFQIVTNKMKQGNYFLKIGFENGSELIKKVVKVRHLNK